MLWIFTVKHYSMRVKSICGKTLSDRVLQYAVNNNTNILKYIFDKKYSLSIKNFINRRIIGEDITVDGIRGLFNNYGQHQNTLLQGFLILVPSGCLSHKEEFSKH